MRGSGVLLPIFSLPSNYGIGAFSKSAYEFVDLLKMAGQKYWQILPLGPTSYGDSPYQSFSTFSGNPYFIDLEELVEDGLLTKAECDAFDFGKEETEVDYGKLYSGRFELLKKAFERFTSCDQEAFHCFLQENEHWLADYALFMAVKESFGGIAWNEWEEGIRLRREDTLCHYRATHCREIQFQQFLQFLFTQQWKNLKSYANKNGIQIIGDIPIYVAFDSADTWANPELFQFDGDNIPTAVAGCPPDGFSATGQLWGNPLYRWDYHKETKYAWWIKRIMYLKTLYDVVRIDHFRGFDEYYAIPYGDKTAEYGQWKSGPGISLFQEIERQLGTLNIIAEDLGFITESVVQLVADSGYPGMKVLEFAFDSREESNYLPHTYGKNCVVYTGTHDNETIVGWYRHLNKQDLEMSLAYMDNAKTPEDQIHWDFVRLAMMSVADTCIIPIQDYLGLDNAARINQPSTLGGNWQWRLRKDQITPELLESVHRLTKISGRM